MHHNAKTTQWWLKNTHKFWGQQIVNRILDTLATFWDKGQGLEESIYKMSSGGSKTIPHQCQNNDCVKLHWWRPSIQFLPSSACLTLTSSLFIKFIFQADTLALCIATLGILLIFRKTGKLPHLHIWKWVLEYEVPGPPLGLKLYGQGLYLRTSIARPTFASDFSLLFICTLRSSRCGLKQPGPCHPRGRPELNSKFLISSWPAMAVGVNPSNT